MTGRKSIGGRQSEQLVLALKQIRYSHVFAHFKQGERFIEHDFSILNEVLIERRASPTDPIVACTIVIAEPRKKQGLLCGRIKRASHDRLSRSGTGCRSEAGTH
jgi:hypothetical protein